MVRRAAVLAALLLAVVAVGNHWEDCSGWVRLTRPDGLALELAPKSIAAITPQLGHENANTMVVVGSSVVYVLETQDEVKAEMARAQLCISHKQRAYERLEMEDTHAGDPPEGSGRPDQ